jgi:hypothetical protein
VHPSKVYDHHSTTDASIVCHAMSKGLALLSWLQGYCARLSQLPLQ